MAKACAANATVAIRNFNPRKLDILISAINSAATDALKAVFESYNRFMLTTSGELNYPSKLPR